MTTTSAATTQRPSVGRKVGSWSLNHGALVGLIILCIALFIATPVFLTVPNIINIGIQAAVVAIMAFGMTFVIVTSGIDLSVGSVAALSAMVSAWMFSNAGLPGWLTLIIGHRLWQVACLYRHAGHDERRTRTNSCYLWRHPRRHL